MSLDPSDRKLRIIASSPATLRVNVASHPIGDPMFGSGLQAACDYWIDACQRSILSLDVLR